MEELLSKQSFDSALADNNVPKDKAVWIQKVIPVLAKQLLDDPIRYRTYGIYWWKIKIILSQGSYDFGDTQEVNINTLYPEPYLYLAAGMISDIARITAGNFDNRYQYQTEDGDTLDYVLEDRDMEMRIASNEIEQALTGH